MLNHAEIALLLAELAPWRGAVIQKVQQEGPESLTLGLRRPGATIFLRFVLQRGKLRFFMQEKKPESLGQPPAFTMALRKHLMGGKLERFEQPAGERIARFFVSRRQGDMTLVAELIPPGGNLVLVDAHARVAARLFNDERNGTLGRPYQPPPAIEGTKAAAVRAFEGASLHAALGADAGSGAVTAARKTAAADVKKRELLLARLAEDERRAGDPGVWRRWGDALAAQPGLPPIGADGFAAFTTPEGEPLCVPLDPALTLHENIARLHQKATKAERARTHIAERRRLLEARTARTPVAAAAPLPRGDDRPATRDPRPPTTDLPHGHVFRYPGGSLIVVGRSATENERITFGFAHGDDEWLHARDVPGSHVVLRRSGADDADALRADAARLALHYSFKRGEPAGDVQWTQRKYVQRVKGAPGKVRLTKEQNVRVAVTAADLARIESRRLTRGR
jgi:predicted ribosome quality control (RQC) complex YloA/Tae2 family protein